MFYFILCELLIKLGVQVSVYICIILKIITTLNNSVQECNGFIQQPALKTPAKEYVKSLKITEGNACEEIYYFGAIVYNYFRGYQVLKTTEKYIKGESFQERGV